MQGVGSLVASVVGYAFLSNLLDQSKPELDPHNKHQLNIIWRLCLGLGAVPGLFTMYSRITMEETERFVLSAASPSTRTETRISLGMRIKTFLVDTATNIKPHWRSLVGTAGSWLLFGTPFIRKYD
jgi:hypothetical protein